MEALHEGLGELGLLITILACVVIVLFRRLELRVEKLEALLKDGCYILE